MTHIIQRQYLHVEMIGTESDGLAVQRRLPGLCQYWLVPALERVLERCAPPAGHLYIERLEIDAGTMSLDRLEHDLADKVVQALEKSLREHLPPGASAPPSISNTIQLKTDQLAIQDALIYFLQTGSLLWSFRLPAGRNLEQVLLVSWREAAESGLYPVADRVALLQVLAAAPARQRLLRQFSPVFLETLLSLLAPELKEVMATILPTLHQADAPPEAKKHFAGQLWKTMFAAVATRQAVTATDLVVATWKVTAAGYPALAKMVEQHWPDAIHQTPSPEFLTMEPSPPAVPGSDKASIPGHEPRQAVAIIPLEPVPPPFPGSGKTFISGGEHPDAREGIYIDNAGLVLLHPFLPQFFAALGLTADDKLLQPERALCLLHFLTAGQTRAPEYELVLPKILCNIPLSTPVEADLEPTGLEIEEANALLEAVVRHWEALRQTSPAGLRGTFLLRPGKVSCRADGDWFLQVETNAFDILLDQLPWGISMIKLPWMAYMLWVEWR